MRLVTLPRRGAEPYRRLWEHFLPDLAVDGWISVQEIEEHIRGGSIQLHLVLEEPDIIRAVVGTRSYWRSGVKVGEIAECAGAGLADWLHLLPEVERALVVNDGAQEIMIERGRPGWRRALAQYGYRTKRMTFGKVLT